MDCGVLHGNYGRVPSLANVSTSMTPLVFGSNVAVMIACATTLTSKGLMPVAPRKGMEPPRRELIVEMPVKRVASGER